MIFAVDLVVVVVLKPKTRHKIAGNVRKDQERQKKYFKEIRRVQFNMGNSVMVQDYRIVNKITWIKSVIKKVKGNRAYIFYKPEIETA